MVTSKRVRILCLFCRTLVVWLPLVRIHFEFQSKEGILCEMTPTCLMIQVFNGFNEKIDM